jgi:hypothetical protein
MLAPLSVSLVALFTGYAYAQVRFARTYGGGNYDIIASVQQTSDGGYIMAGYTEEPISTTWRDPLLIKTDAFGNIIWAKAYRGTYDDASRSAQQTSDGGYIMAGWTNSSGWGGFNFLLIKTDANGNIQWAKAYGGMYWDEAISVRQTSDGGYIVAGYTYSFGTGSQDVLLIKTDANGNVQWAKTYGRTIWDEVYPNSVQQTSDGGYIVAGYIFSYLTFQYNIFLIKTDANGNVQWAKTYRGPWGEEAYFVQQTSDGGYIVTGLTASGAGYGDAFLIKTDANGNVQWARTYGGTGYDYASSIQRTSDGGYIVAGYTESFGAVWGDAFLIKTDANGNVQWAKTYGGTHNDWASSVQQTSDGGYIVATGTRSFGAGHYDFLLIKTDANGNIGSCGIVRNVTPTVTTLSVTVTTFSPYVVSVSPTVTSPSLTVMSLESPNHANL